MTTRGFFFFLRFVLFAVLLFCLVDPLRHCVISFGEEGAGYFSLVCGLCTVCHGVFALPLGVIGRLFL